MLRSVLLFTRVIERPHHCSKQRGTLTIHKKVSVFDMSQALAAGPTVGMILADFIIRRENSYEMVQIFTLCPR